MYMAIPLILINLLLILGIGLIRQANPFETWVLGLLFAANLIFVMTASIMTHQDPLRALSVLGTNFLPVAVGLGGIALVLTVMFAGPRKKRSRT